MSTFLVKLHLLGKFAQVCGDNRTKLIAVGCVPIGGPVHDTPERGGTLRLRAVCARYGELDGTSWI